METTIVGAKSRKPNPARGSKPGERRGGRQKGTPNKTTGLLKDMILSALNQAHEGGAVEYLKTQANANPAAFLTLVGKVLPLQVNGPGENGEHVTLIKLVGVRPDGG
jgi:hypothetical protein